MTDRPMTEGLENALEAAERILDEFERAPTRIKARGDSEIVARALLSTSAAVRGMREALEKILTAQDVGDEVMVVETATKALSVLSGIETEQAPAKGDDNGQA